MGTGRLKRAPGPTYSASSLTLVTITGGDSAASTTPSATTTYLYDAVDSGSKSTGTTTTATTSSSFYERRSPAWEYDAAHLIEETVWVGDVPVPAYKPTGAGGVSMFYIHADHLNTPKAITRPADNLSSGAGTRSPSAPLCRIRTPQVWVTSSTTRAFWGSTSMPKPDSNSTRTGIMTPLLEDTSSLIRSGCMAGSTRTRMSTVIRY